VAFSWHEARSGASFGSGVTVFNVANFAVRNADYFLIGRVLGPTQLGFYSVAYRMMLMPVQVISGSFGRVLFPLMSRADTESVILRTTYLQALGAVGFIAFPLGLILAVLAHRLVPVLLGPGWEPAVSVLQILAIVGIGQAIGSTTGPIWMAKGRVREMATYGVLGGSVVIAGFLLTVRAGIVAVAASYLITSALALLLPSLLLAYRHIGLSMRQAISVLERSAGIAVMSALVVFTVDRSVEGWPDLPALLLDLTVAGGVIAALSLTWNRAQLTAVLDLTGLRTAVARVRRFNGTEST
jgi:PST family polysaccharide transporter